MPNRSRPSEPGPSLEGCAGAVVGFTLAYLSAEATLSGAPHPVHWGVTLLGAIIGYAIGHAVYLYKAGRTQARGARRPRRRR